MLKWIVNRFGELLLLWLDPFFLITDFINQILELLYHLRLDLLDTFDVLLLDETSVDVLDEFLQALLGNHSDLIGKAEFDFAFQKLQKVISYFVNFLWDVTWCLLIIRFDHLLDDWTDILSEVFVHFPFRSSYLKKNYF